MSQTEQQLIAPSYIELTEDGGVYEIHDHESEKSMRLTRSEALEVAKAIIKRERACSE